MTYTAATASADLDTALDVVIGALRAETSSDWSRPAGSLEWSCWQTAQHIGQVGAHYASQVAVAARSRYVRWAARAQQPDAPPDGVLDFAEAAGRILALVVRASPDELRAFHPYGIADPAGFAAGGSVELLMHGHDIATGLGATFEPPRDICERLLARLFPHRAVGIAGVEPWRALCWVTGRADLAQSPRPTSWTWRATPLAEEWVRTEPEPARFANGAQ